MEISDTTLVALIGLFGGVLLGLAARVGRFCTLGAIEDLLYQSSDLRMRMWGIAIATAIIGSFALIGLGLLDPGKTLYLGQSWYPLASILGGLVFGYGMALAGNCGYGALARLGGGDLRSFVIVMVMGLSAYVTLSGPLARLRVWAFPPEPASAPAGLAHLLGARTGLSPVAIGLALGVVLLAAVLSSRALWSRPMAVVWGAVVGLAVVSGWAGTAWLAETSLDAVPVSSHTFAAASGEAMLYAMTSSGGTLSFAVGLGRGRSGGRVHRVADQGPFPLGSLRGSARVAPPDPRRRADGRRRGAGHRMHHRSGHVGVLAAGLFRAGHLSGDPRRGRPGPAPVDRRLRDGSLKPDRGPADHGFRVCAARSARRGTRRLENLVFRAPEDACF